MDRSDPDPKRDDVALRERARIVAWLRDCARVVRCLEQTNAVHWTLGRAELYEQIAQDILAGQHLPGGPEGPF
jgi:hypothetical protein